jgi:hypothetical protein
MHGLFIVFDTIYRRITVTKWSKAYCLITLPQVRIPHAECTFYTHDNTWFIHAECNFFTHCDFDTYECDHDTHDCDFYTQSVILTRMSVIMTLTIMITTRTNVRKRLVSARRVRFLHAECDFTRRVWFPLAQE